MGVAHFQAMYEAACEVDARAFPMAVVIDTANHMVNAVIAAGMLRSSEHSLPDFWDMPFDQIVKLSRGLLASDDHYIAQLQQLLLENKIEARMPTKDGSMRSTNDPRVFTFDDVKAPNEETLLGLMLEYQPEWIAKQIKEKLK